MVILFEHNFALRNQKSLRWVDLLIHSKLFLMPSWRRQLYNLKDNWTVRFRFISSQTVDWIESFPYSLHCTALNFVSHLRFVTWFEFSSKYEFPLKILEFCFSKASSAGFLISLQHVCHISSPTASTFELSARVLSDTENWVWVCWKTSFSLSFAIRFWFRSRLKPDKL